MNENSLVEQSKSLKGLALESFIIDCTSQGENHNFHQILSHPNIRSTQPRSIAILELFCKGNFSDYRAFCEKNGNLSEKQIFTLKKLTLLSQFKGQHEVLLSSLGRKIGSTEEELMAILLKMSIDGSVTVKIDQHKGQINILYSDVRAKPIESQDTEYMRLKIESMIQKNQKVESQLEEIIFPGQKSENVRIDIGRSY